MSRGEVTFRSSLAGKEVTKALDVVESETRCNLHEECTDLETT